MALAASHHDVVVVEDCQVSSERRAGFGAVVIVSRDVGVDVAQGNGGGELLAQHSRVGSIDAELVRLDRHSFFARHDVTKGEVADGSGERLIVSEADIADGVQQSDSCGEFAKPGSVVNGEAGTGNREGIFCRIPELRMHVGVGGSADVTHTAGTGVGCNGL